MSHPYSQGDTLQLPDGRRLTLGPMLARAGEGTVYDVMSHPEWVVKIFHPTLKDLASKLDKVQSMVQVSPPGAVQPNGFVVLTWPAEVVQGGRLPIGFVMPRVDTTCAVEIHTVSNPVDRHSPLPSEPQWTRGVTWTHLLNIAANLCLAVQVVHQVDAVIGDFQERNILVSNTTQVTLVDCDSMQFSDRSGVRYLCPVGRPEYTAPELMGRDLRCEPRDRSSDLFALAVHIHQLLLAGNHPFLRGVWTGGGDQPDALTLAAGGHWAGGPGSLLLTHPSAPPVEFLPEQVRNLFVRAFTEGARNPAVRPSAAEWRDALLDIQTTLCAAGRHQVPVGAKCPWCATEIVRWNRRLARFRRPGPGLTSGLPGRHAPTDALQSVVESVPVLPTAPVSAPSRLVANANTVVVVIWTVATTAVLVAIVAIWLILGDASLPGPG